MESLISPNGEKLSSVRKVTDVKPFGSSILIEHLSTQEVLGTGLFVGENADSGSAPQAYVVALGPKLDADSGIKVGDRIIVQGTFIPVPNLSANRRVRGIVEIHNIKAVLTED